jgi:ABC-2 type transport system ATP-binding protein
MIVAENLTKRYGTKTAVDDVSFEVHPGRVTGFLGPNGAGKSTTMRMILGLDRPTAGRVTLDGRAYRNLAAPMLEVGALIDAKALHGGRTARDHLVVLAKSNGIALSRVDEVLDTVGLASVAKKRSGGFSLGMGQRLGIAGALLGDPRVLLFDEPVNGLDPEGILWIRNLMKRLASEGRTVFVSSHLMNEMAVTADHLLVIGRGRILADTGVEQFIAENSISHVKVRSPQGDELARLGSAEGWEVTRDRAGALLVPGVTTDQVGRLAGQHGIFVYELAKIEASLEEAFMRLTADSVEYHTGGEPPKTAGAVPGWGPPTAADRIG